MNMHSIANTVARLFGDAHMLNAASKVQMKGRVTAFCPVLVVKQWCYSHGTKQESHGEQTEEGLTFGNGQDLHILRFSIMPLPGNNSQKKNVSRPAMRIIFKNSVKINFTQYEHSFIL